METQSKNQLDQNYTAPHDPQSQQIPANSSSLDAIEANHHLAGHSADIQIAMTDDQEYLANLAQGDHLNDITDNSKLKQSDNLEQLNTKIKPFSTRDFQNSDCLLNKNLEEEKQVQYNLSNNIDRELIMKFAKISQDQYDVFQNCFEQVALGRNREDVFELSQAIKDSVMKDIFSKTQPSQQHVFLLKYLFKLNEIDEEEVKQTLDMCVGKKIVQTQITMDVFKKFSQTQDPISASLDNKHSTQISQEALEKFQSNRQEKLQADLQNFLKKNIKEDQYILAMGKRKRNDAQTTGGEKQSKRTRVDNQITNYGVMNQNNFNFPTSMASGQIIINLCNCNFKKHSSSEDENHPEGKNPHASNDDKNGSSSEDEDVINFDAFFNSNSSKIEQMLLSRSNLSSEVIEKQNFSQEDLKQFKCIQQMIQYLQDQAEVRGIAMQDKLCYDWLILVIVHVVNTSFFGNHKQIQLNNTKVKISNNIFININQPLLQFNGSLLKQESCEFYPAILAQLKYEDVKIQVMKQLLVDFQKTFNKIFCCTDDFPEKLKQALSILQEYRSVTKKVSIPQNKLRECYKFKLEGYLGDTSIQKFQDSMKTVVNTTDKIRAATTRKRDQTSNK